MQISRPSAPNPSGTCCWWRSFFFCLFVVYAPHPLFNYSIVVVSIRLPLRILLFALASVCFIRRNFARFIFNSRCSSVVFFNYSNLLFYFAFNCCTNLKMYNIIIKKNWSLCITCIYIWLCGIGNAYSLQSDSGPKAGRRDRGGGGYGIQQHILDPITSETVSYSLNFRNWIFSHALLRIGLFYDTIFFRLLLLALATISDEQNNISANLFPGKRFRMRFTVCAMRV